ncbi:MAG: heme-binding protein [Paracoccaceae bacterium]
MKHAIFAALIVTCPTVAAAQDDALVQFQSLRPMLAMDLAVATMQACQAEGYQVGVSVVDRFGIEQVFIRDRYAGAHTIETAFRKAWTAVSFKTDTLSLAEATAPGTISSGIREISQALPLGGGVMIEVGGTLVGGIGVSGAPGPDIDDRCARAGLSAIEDQLPF